MTQLTLSDRIEEHICIHYQLPADEVATMLPKFFWTLHSHMQDIEASIGSADPQSIARAGHKLKGALLNLGLDDIAEIAENIENDGRSGRRDSDYGELAMELKDKLKEIL